MKKAMLLKLLILQGALFAQDNTAQMQEMLDAMQKIQICMSKIDFNALSALQEEAIKVETKINQMCQEGKRDEAQKSALAFSKKVINLPAIKQMRACSKDSPLNAMIPTNANQLHQGHVCDVQKIEFGIPSNQRIDW